MRLSVYLLLAVCLIAAIRPVAAGEEGGGQETRDKTEEILLRSLLDEKEKQAQAANEVTRGNRLAEARLYVQAAEAYRKALILDPANRQAALKLTEVNAYIETRSDLMGAPITRETQRAAIAEQHKLMEARNYIEKAASLIIQAEEPISEETGAVDRAKACVSRLSLLEDAAKFAMHAKLQLNGLSAKVEAQKHKDQVAAMEARMRYLRQQFESALEDAKNIIAAQDKALNREEAERFNERKKEELLRDAATHQGSEQFDKAERIVEEVLDMDPANDKARAMLMEIKRQRRQTRETSIRETGIEERRRVLENIERRAIAEVSTEEPIKYPADWNDLVSRKVQRNAASTVQESEAVRRIRQALQNRYTFDFEEAPMTDVRDTLMRRTNINIVLDVEDDVAGVSLNLHDMRLENILKWIMEITGLNYEIRDEAIYITTQEKLRGKKVTRVYDIRDLTAVEDSRKMPGLPEDDDDDDDETDTIAFDEIIRRVLASDFVDDKGEVSYSGGNLLVVNTVEAQRRVSELLSKLRAASAIQVSITARFLTVHDDFWEEFESRLTKLNNYLTTATEKDTGSQKNRDPGDASFTDSRHFQDLNGTFSTRTMTALRSVMGDNLGSSLSPTAGLSTTLTQTGWLGQLQTNWVLRAVKETAKSDELFAPHLVVYNNREGWYRMSNSTPFVRTWQLAPNGYDLEQVMDEVNADTSLLVCPTVSSDKKYITLDIRPQFTRLIALNSTAMVGGTVFYPIDLPVIFEHTARTFATLPDGGSIVISGMSVNVHMRARNGIPLLQDIPLLGSAFSRRAYQKEKRNFVIMANAQMILLEEEEARQAR
jgi:type II secretory pathway component GspD/PulD (secretin)